MGVAASDPIRRFGYGRLLLQAAANFCGQTDLQPTSSLKVLYHDSGIFQCVFTLVLTILDSSPVYGTGISYLEFAPPIIGTQS